MTSTVRVLCVALCASLPLLIGVAPVAAGTDRGVGPSHTQEATFAKRTHGTWRAESTERVRESSLADVTADAWRWYLSLPIGIANDTSGANCGVNQRGEFWFLGGPLGQNYTTPCTIPVGKTIVVFVAAYVANDCPGDFTTDPVPKAREFLGAFATEVADGFVGPAAELDRQPLKVRRVTTGVFPFTSGADWVEIPDGCFTGSPQIAVADGYWAVLPPLPRGDHTLSLTVVDPSTTGVFNLRIR